MPSLVDPGSRFDVVRQMSVFPVGRTQLFQVAVIACLPGVPLVFLVLLIAEVPPGSLSDCNTTAAGIRQAQAQCWGTSRPLC
jgi:hypothetical protein